MNHRRITATTLLLAASVCIVRAQDQPANDSLAQRVPADVGLFVEARGADDLLVLLTDEQVWVTLAELAGQPARPEDAREWRRRIRQTVKMEPRHAISVLFSQRVAFVGEGPGRAQDAVVLCQPSDVLPIDGLLRLWEAKPWPDTGAADTYRLQTNVGLAVRDHTLIFGDALLPQGMFRRVAKFSSAEPSGSLAQDTVYKQLLTRVPPKPDAVLFARMGRSGTLPYPASMPASTRPSAHEALRPALPELPGPLRGAANILLAMHRAEPLLHFTAVGDARLPMRERSAELRPLVATLPETTLIAWASHIDFPGLTEAIEKLPPRNALRIAIRLPEQPELVAQMFEALRTETCLAVGWVTPESRPVTAPPVPALAMLVSAKDAQVVETLFEQFVQSWITVYDFLSLTGGLPPLRPRMQVQLGQNSAYVQDLSNLLRGADGGAIGELELCWTLDEGVLILASHRDWLRQILEARHERAPTLATVLELTQRPISPRSESIIVSQNGPIADLGARWLKFLKEHAPDTLEEKWWRNKQPGGGSDRIGIIVNEDNERRRLRVTAVRNAMPADGVLKEGDEIIGCNRKRFATTQPVQEMQRAIKERPNARWLELEVERDGVGLALRIPLPFVNPVEMLRRIVAIGKIAQRVVYHDDRPQEAGARGFLTIELRKSQRPLFDFDRSPASQPADAGEQAKE